MQWKVSDNKYYSKSRVEFRLVQSECVCNLIYRLIWQIISMSFAVGQLRGWDWNPWLTIQKRITNSLSNVTFHRGSRSSLKPPIYSVKRDITPGSIFFRQMLWIDFHCNETLIYSIVGKIHIVGRVYFMSYYTLWAVWPWSTQSVKVIWRTTNRVKVNAFPELSLILYHF